MKNCFMTTAVIAISMMLAGCTAAQPAMTVAESKNAEAENNMSNEVTDDAQEADTAENKIPNEPDMQDVVDTTETTDDEIVNEDSGKGGSDGLVKKHTGIVWLGDSLTQGSLGHENDNLPNAPYERLQEKVDIPVEGYGMYAVNTHDILWVYRDEDHLGQKIDPDKIYIFWVGSNDWVVDGDPNSDTKPVIDEVDKFIAEGNLTDYVFIGTTSRWKLGDLYIPINKELAEHYGEHYMDVIDIINKFGYSEDNTHLSQASYDSIADAVYDKMKALGYL